MAFSVCATASAASGQWPPCALAARWKKWPFARGSATALPFIGPFAAGPEFPPASFAGWRSPLPCRHGTWTERRGHGTDGLARTAAGPGTRDRGAGDRRPGETDPARAAGQTGAAGRWRRGARLDEGRDSRPAGGPRRPAGAGVSAPGRRAAQCADQPLQHGYLSPLQRPRLPAAGPGIQDPAGVPVLTVAAVVAGQRGHPVALLQVEVEFQYLAAVAQVGGQIGEVVVGAADLVLPEGHDLHQPLGPDP